MRNPPTGRPTVFYNKNRQKSLLPKQGQNQGPTTHSHCEKHTIGNRMFPQAPRATIDSLSVCLECLHAFSFAAYLLLASIL